jgi:hypothetical protein
MVIAHGGELIFPVELADQVQSFMRALSQSLPDLAGGPMDLLASPAARIVGEGIRKREAAITNISNAINVNVVLNNTFPAGMAAKALVPGLAGQVEDELYRRVNKGIESGKVDLRRF